MGKAESPRRDAYLRRKYGNIPNLKMTGWIDQFSSQRFRDVLSKSWILINTDLRAGLPAPFVEAAAYKCAILSCRNPDGLSSEFGYWAKKDDFAKGLNFLLMSDNWRKLGERGYEYVKKTHNLDIVVKKHIQLYTSLLG